MPPQGQKNRQTPPGGHTGAAPAVAPTPDGPALPLVEGENQLGMPPTATPNPEPALTFTHVPWDEMLAVANPTKPRKYAKLEEALLALPENTTLAVAIPEGKDPDQFASNILSNIRRNVPKARSKAAAGKLYMWVGEPLRKSKTGGKK